MAWFYTCGTIYFGGGGGGIASAEYSIYLGRGQSLSIGTQDGTYNSKPDQPQLDQSRFFMLGGVETIGTQNELLTTGDITGLVGLEEDSSILAQQSYYSPATGCLSAVGSGTSGKYIWLPSGIGGTSIEDLSASGTKNAVANEITQFEYLQSNNVSADVKAITFYHGGANFSDTKDEYYNKLIAYKNEQLARVNSYYPQSSPKFLLWQHGGENVVAGVMQAQLQAHKNGEALCIGATYWLNRKFPNVSEKDVTDFGSGSVERVHLKTKGYQYAGEMIKYAEEAGFSPLYVNNYEWLDGSNLTLSCVGNVSGGLVVDVTDQDIPAFNGNGIELLKPNGIRIPATSVTTSGSNINVSFGSDEFIAGDRIVIGLTPRDISYYGDYVPNPQGSNYVGNVMVGTNIRTANARASTLGNDDFYDWLCVDSIDTEVKTSTPVEQTLGSNIWFGDSYGDVGFGTILNFDSTTGTLTKTVDGVEQAAVPTTRNLGASTNKETIAWAIRAGNTYQVDLDVADMNDAGRLQFFVGGAGLTITLASLVNGHYTGEITATTDFNYSMTLRENTGFATTDFNGVVSNIQLRQKLV